MNLQKSLPSSPLFVSDVGERGVIDLAKRIPHFGARRLLRGIGDDCAVIRGPGRAAILLTVDVAVEGVHFLREWDLPQAVGAKLLSACLSDIAAMGGEPQDALLAMMLPPSLPLDWVERFFRGFSARAKAFRVNLAGGDVSSHPACITLALSLTGRMRRDEVIYRSRGCAGDRLFISGTVGDAEAGLRMLRRGVASDQWERVRKKVDEEIAMPGNSLPPEDEEGLILRTLVPSPRVELGRLLSRTRTARAMIDLSDGLVPSLKQLGEASKMEVVIFEDRLPLSPALRWWAELEGEHPCQVALKGGEDYELLFAVPPHQRRRVERFHRTHPTLPPLTEIGYLRKGTPGEVWLVKSDGLCQSISQGGWEHFKRGDD